MPTEAKIAIWICEKARQSHIEVTEWLNESSPDDMGFYLTQLQLGKIDENYIPRFEIVNVPLARSSGLSFAVRARSAKSLISLEIKRTSFWSAL